MLKIEFKRADLTSYLEYVCVCLRSLLSFQEVM